MEVFKWALNKTVLIGNDAYFVIIVENTGNCALHGIKIVEIFNSTEMTYVNHTKQDLWNKNGNIFTYNGVLAPGERVNFTVWFKTLIGGDIVNTVNATSEEAENLTVNNHTYVLNPNLTVEKLSLNNTVRVDDKVIFTIVVTNTGNCDLANITVVENIPEGLAYNTFDGDNWTKSDNGYVFNYALVLAPGDSISFNITFDAREGGHWTNVVDAKSNMTQDKEAYNVTFVEGPGMEVFKLTLNKTVYIGNDTYFVIVITNTGNCALHDIRITELFNVDELSYANHTNRGLWIKEGNVFAYQGVLAVNESTNFTIWFNTLVGGNITNTIEATSEEAENLTVENHTYVLSPDLSVQKVTLNKTVIIGN